MRENLRELWKFRELLWAMVERELRIRYKNSFLGFFWSLLNPLVTVAVMTVVFKYLMQNSTPNFSAYVLAAYLPFLFFNMTLMDSAQSVLVSLPVVRKVYFPREILPLASIASNFIHFILALLVFFAYLFVLWAVTGFDISPFTYRMWFLPIVLVVNLCLVTGLALIISALNVFYEDIKYILSVGLYLLFFITPIMYFSETVFYALSGRPNGKLLYDLYHLNPVATFSTMYRKVLLAPQDVQVLRDGVAVMEGVQKANWVHFGITTVMSIGILIYGYHLFNKLKWKFVEKP